MEQKFCEQCGGDINLVYVHPSRIFCITKDGKIIRDDNNIMHHVNNDDPYFVARCSNDITHKVWDQEGLDMWIDGLEKEIKTRQMEVV